MFKRNIIATAVAFACTGPVFGQQDSELAKIRDEIRLMKESYERRIQVLERRLADTETKAGKAEQTAAKAETTAVANASRTTPSQFNPAISLTLQGAYSRTTQDPNTYQITGFVPSGGEVGPPRRSFGLAETELAISASIDPYFRGVVIAALTPENEVEVEEAYFQTLSLSKGLIVKGGRFFSGIGYQNEIHPHAWDFHDAPLPYKAFLGGRLRQEGVQLKWVAPTDLFIELGAELASGDQFPGSDRNRNGVGATSFFGHLGGDIGASYAWRAGLSHLRTSSQNRGYDDVDALGNAVSNSFSGKAKMWVADAVLKWAPQGNATYNHFKLQGEYFRVRQDGALTYDDTQGVPQFGGATFTDAFRTAQSGWYAQGVWQFMPRWRVGYRYDALSYGRVTNGIVNSGLGPTAADFSVLTPHRPTRNTAMLDFSLSEFSRLRLQLAADKSRLGATDNQVIIQYLHSLGAHGAHRF